MTIRSSTGASGTMTLQTTNNVSAVTTFATGSGDTLTFAGHVLGIGNLTVASGTPGSVCYVTATGQMTKNAATSCVVSSARFKTDIATLPLSVANDIVTRVRPMSFRYRDGGRRAIGAIAEQVDSIDKRLVFYDAQGRPTSVAYEQITIALLAVVQQQQRAIDSLRTAVRRR